MHLFVFVFPLVLKVFFYYLLIRILAHRIHIISARPKLTAPKQPLDLGMKPENLLRRDALDSSDYLFRSISRNALDQKMHMASIYTDLQK